MKASKTLYSIFKAVVIVVSVIYIAYKLYIEFANGTLFAAFHRLNYKHIIILLLLLVLVVINWSLESVKFKVLLKPIQIIKFLVSFKAVLAGITVSIFTPKRIGDFGGRVFALEPKNRINGIFATLLGSYSQLIVTLTFGVCLLPFYMLENETIRNVFPNNGILFFGIGVVILLSLFVYLNIPLIGKYLLQVRFFYKHKNIIEFVKQYNKSELLKVIGISALRYVIFTFQMFLFLEFFGVDIGYANALIGISQIYLYMTFVPTLALGELGVRGSLSVWVLSVFTSASSGVIAASVLLWFCNLAIPALIGNYFLWKFKY